MSKVHFCYTLYHSTVHFFFSMLHMYLFYLGMLTLPYSDDELKEPFEVWYDLEGNRSRINYHNSQ